MEVYLIKQEVNTDNYRGSEVVGFVSGDAEKANRIVDLLNELDESVGEEILGRRRNSYYKVIIDEITESVARGWFTEPK